MIPDILITLGVMALKFVNWVLSFFSLPYISNMCDAITWFIGLFRMFEGIWPVGTTMLCLTVLILTEFYKYQIKLFFHTVFPLIPIIGRHINLPTIEHQAHPVHDEIEFDELYQDPKNPNTYRVRDSRRHKPLYLRRWKKL